MDVGDRIKAQRNSKKWTLKQLAATVGISVSFLSDIENGKSKPSLERLQEIAQGLGTTVSYLLGEDDRMRRNDLAALPGVNDAPVFAEVEKELKDFSEWSVEDKKELLAYLQAKRIARRRNP